MFVESHWHGRDSHLILLTMNNYGTRDVMYQVSHSCHAVSNTTECLQYQLTVSNNYQLIMNSKLFTGIDILIFSWETLSVFYWELSTDYAEWCFHDLSNYGISVYDSYDMYFVVKLNKKNSKTIVVFVVACAIIMKCTCKFTRDCPWVSQKH